MSHEKLKAVDTNTNSTLTKETEESVTLPHLDI